MVLVCILNCVVFFVVFCVLCLLECQVILILKLFCVNNNVYVLLIFEFDVVIIVILVIFFFGWFIYSLSIGILFELFGKIRNDNCCLVCW